MNTIIKEKINFPLFIGSKNRIEFPMYKRIKGAYLFVESQEYDAYKKRHGNNFKYVKIKKNNQGFGYLVHRMQQFAIKKGFKYWMFCDDDILNYSTRERKPVKLKTIYEELVKDIKQTPGGRGSQAMISFRGHNWFYKKDIKYNIGAWCILVNATEKIDAVGGYDKKLSAYTDWDMSAKLMRAGYYNSCNYKYCFDHVMKMSKKGGNDVYQKQSLLDAARDKLRERYGYGAIREIESHGRTEIRFIWKKIIN